ncbi:heterogeneous nuclear ribonucleoprotein F-like [Oppia nitens]|uniref:heterogeneous nuclear ribonucleoprotein F-like n=1 Tax=Oppia nitens TaxID=1686743 RepID=UPI0023DB0D83|nr:heterogeneous nuclear ribonucleoprotein F-like [Oppia nitens]
MMSDEAFVVRIRGLPWQTTREEIVDFFNGCNIKNGLNGVLMTLSREGRPSGEAYVEFATEQDYNLALDRNHKHLGQRYIEVFASKKSEMERVGRIHGNDLNDNQHHEDSFVRLRGLPFSANKDDVIEFFSGLDLVMDGIVLPTDHSGRSTGEAYIQFATRDNADKAMSKHKDKIGHRYIEIFKSSFQEFRQINSYMDSKQYSSGPPHGYGLDGPSGGYGPPPQSSPPPYAANHKMRYGHPPSRPVPYPNRFRGGGGGSGFYGNGNDNYGSPITGASRGPPPVGSYRRVYDYEEMDFRGRSSFDDQFGATFDEYPPQGPSHQNSMPFSNRHNVHMRGLPFKTTEGEIYEFFLPLRPISVQILMDDLGRPSGEADVEFATHDDAVKAMNKDKAFIQKRYIELFLHSNSSTSHNNNNIKREPTSTNYYRNGSGGADNHRIRPMGNWSSSGGLHMNDDMIRSRV